MPPPRLTLGEKAGITSGRDRLVYSGYAPVTALTGCASRGKKKDELSILLDELNE